MYNLYVNASNNLPFLTCTLVHKWHEVSTPQGVAMLDGCICCLLFKAKYCLQNRLMKHLTIYLVSFSLTI